MTHSEIINGLTETINSLGIYADNYFMCNLLKENNLNLEEISGFTLENFINFVQTNYKSHEQYLRFPDSSKPQYERAWVPYLTISEIEKKAMVDIKKAFLQSILDKYEQFRDN